MLIWMCSVALAHPFQSQFVGHKSTLEIYPNRLTVSFDLEVPLPLVERAFQESGHSNKKQWLTDWMSDQQADIEENLWLEVDGIRQSQWGQVSHDRPMWKEESKFLVFSVTLEHASDQDMGSILLLDQVLIGEPSVYWTNIALDNHLVVYATDTIEINDRNRYSTHLKRWEMEEQRREIRLTLGNPFWKRIDGWWRHNILRKSEFVTVKEAFLPMDTFREWKLGNTPFWIGILSVLLAVIVGYKTHWKEHTSLNIIALSGLFVPTLPSTVRLAAMGFLICCMPFIRFRWVLVGICAIVLCDPSWVLLAGFVVGGSSRLFRTWMYVDKK